LSRSDIAATLAIGAALCNALTSVFQRVANVSAPEDSTFSWRLIVFLIRRPIWWLGVLAILGAFAFQGLALNFGQISTVQPILASELVFIMIIAVIWFRNSVRLREWGAALALSFGLAAFLYIADPVPGNGNPSNGDWVKAAVGALIVVLVAILLAQRGSAARRAALYGSAAAVIWAFNAAVTKQMTEVIRMGWSELFFHWPVYGVVVVGASGLVVVQSAFQAGPLAYSLPALMIIDPLVSILIGIYLFGERLNGGSENAIAEMTALSLMVVGAFALSRSPAVRESGAEVML